MQWSARDLWSIGGGVGVCLHWCSNICIDLWSIGGGGRVCLPWYLCILLYVKHSQCSGLPQIYGQLEEGMGSVYTDICAYIYMWNVVSVVVYHRSMVDWRRGGVCLHWYLCILQYVQNSWCSGLPEIYGQLEEGAGSVYNGVVILHRSMVNWRRGVGSVYTGICAFFYMWNTVSVVVFHRSMVNWRRGWGLSTLVSVHTSICEM